MNEQGPNYRIDELMKKEHHTSTKDSRQEEIEFDPALTQEIEDALIKPFVDVSLQAFVPTPLVSYAHECARKKVEGHKMFQEYTGKLQKGIEALKKAGLWQDVQEPISSFTVPMEAFGITQESMERFYEEACRQYHHKEYIVSSYILEVLLYLNPKVSVYWQLLGMVDYALNHKELAIEAWETGLQKGSVSLIPYMQMIQCLIDLQKIPEAIEWIKTSLKVQNPVDPDAESLQASLRTIQQALEKEAIS